MNLNDAYLNYKLHPSEDTLTALLEAVRSVASNASADTMRRLQGVAKPLGARSTDPATSHDAVPSQFTKWDRVEVPGRPDFIGVRTLPSGEREFLTHNEALCSPYYLG